MGTTRFINIGNCEKGSAILIVMGLLAMLTAVAIMSVDRSNTDMELSSNQLQEERAFYLAEAGLERALVDINKDCKWRAGYYKQTLEGGNYTIEVIDSTARPGLLDTVVLEGEGIYYTTLANVEAWIAPIYYKPFVFAAYGDDSVKLYNHGCTDSYNSDSGTYATTQLNEGGDVGSNGSISTKNISTVNGGAQTSDTGGITIQNPSKITGDTTSTAPVFDNSAVSDDEFAWGQANSIAPGGFSGKFTYVPGTKALSLGTSDTLTLASGVYYLSSISIANKSVIKLAPGAKVTIYMTGNLTMNQLSSVNKGGVPANLIVYSKGSAFTMGQNTTFVGGFWGANANVTLQQSASLYGSVAAKSTYIANFSCVHFDRSLLKYQTKKIKYMPMVAWRQT